LARLSAVAVRITERARRVRDDLSPKQRAKFEWWVGRLRDNAFAGDQVPKDRIPAVLAQRNSMPGRISNAWRFELPLAYRGIYTIQSRTQGPEVIILEVLSHKEYDRIFGYRS